MERVKLRPLETLARLTAAGLVISGLVSLAEGIAMGIGYDPARWMTMGSYRAHFDPSLPLSAFTAVVFLVWLDRARKNLKALGEELHGYGAVIVWFVPIVNFWLPYQVVREIWQRSGKPAATPTVEPTPWFMRAWWACWVASMFAPAVETTYGVAGFIVLGKLLRVAAAGFAVAVVLDLSDRQRLRAGGSTPSAF